MKPYHRIPLYYLALGVVWILVSDQMVATLAPSSAALNLMQTGKGWFFVLASTLVIYLLTKRAFEQTLRDAEEKRAIFRKTLEGSDHILLNYLNQMQLVTLEASTCESFDPKVLALAQQLSDEAVAELKNLESLQMEQSGDIDSYVYRKLRAARHTLERAKPDRRPR